MHPLIFFDIKRVFMAFKKTFFMCVLCLVWACSSERDEWLSRLTYRNPGIRVQAAEFLGSYGDTRAVPELIKALSDSDTRVRFAACEALGKLGDKRAVDSLVSRVGDPEVMVGLEAVAALSVIGGDPSLEALQTLVDSGHGSVRLAALQGLGQRQDARSIPVLTAALKDSFRGARWVASMALGQVSDARSVGPLVGVLDEGDEEVREVMVTALDQIDAAWRSSKAATHTKARLIEALKEDGGLTPSRYGSIQALREMDPAWKQRADARAVRDYFVGQLENSDAAIRRNAAQALGDLGDEEVVEVLLKATDDPSPQVRYVALEALGKMGRGRATDALLKGLESKDPGTVSFVAQALGGMGDARAVGPLMAMVTNSKLGVFRLGAMQTLGRLKDARAVGPLAGLLSDSSVQTRRVAAEALGDVGSAEAVTPLVGTLNDMSAEVRWAAADALGNIGDSSVVDTLIGAIGAGRIWSQRMVLVLDRLDTNWRSRDATTRVVNYFVENMDHPTGEVQWRSAEALGQIGNDHAEVVLGDAMAQKNLLVMAAAHPFYIRRGVLGSEQLLVEALNVYGTEDIALTYLNAGHPLLRQAALSWGRKRGTVLLPSPKLGDIHWQSR
jgi:HEAT repeat protein